MIIKKEQGFTLIEVMIALVILSIGLGSLLVATTQNLRTYQLLENRMVESWVDIQASNLLKLGLVQPRISIPYSSSTNFMGKKCYWQISLQPTQTQTIMLAKISSKMTPIGKWDHLSYTFYKVQQKDA